MTINQKIYVALASIALLTTLLTVFVIYPFFLDIQKNSEELLQEKEKIIFLSQEAKGREKIEALYRAHQQDFSAIEKFFIDPEVPLDLINFLEETASTSNAQLAISSVTKNVAKKDPWSSLLLQLSLSATTPDFLQFLEQVETSPYLIEVLALTLGETAATLTVKVFTK